LDINFKIKRADCHLSGIVLVFSKTAAYHHKSIAAGNIAIQKLGKENNFGVDATTDSLKFNLDIK
jgi:hypothetical protein